MLLGIDIGNTNILMAVMNKKGRIIERRSIPTHGRKISAVLRAVKKRNKIDRILVVSVVPVTLSGVKKELKKIFKNKRIFVVGKDIKVPLKSLYNPRQIGQDRLVTALAASTLYGLPILIVDFGTAVTFDAVSEKNVYMGGLIMPGIKMSLESLFERTAMLPMIYLRKTRTLIGRDTRSSMINGMVYGYSSMCEGIIRLFRTKIGKNLKVVATGGDAALIGKYTSSMKTIDTDLPLKGLFLLDTD